jgi:hypothetical protein
LRRKVNTRALSSWRRVGLLDLSRDGADIRRGNVPCPRRDQGLQAKNEPSDIPKADEATVVVTDAGLQDLRGKWK